METGDSVIILQKVEMLGQADYIQNYRATTYSIFPESEFEIDRIIDRIALIKQQAKTRGSGSLTNEGLFHGSSVLVSSTLNYSTYNSNGITYGGITSVYVQCTPSNNTVIDNISLVIHQEGFTEVYGKQTYESSYGISNYSTTYAPSSLAEVRWENGINSLVGSRVTIVVHRGTSTQYSYSLVNNIIE